MKTLNNKHMEKTEDSKFEIGKMYYTYDAINEKHYVGRYVGLAYSPYHHFVNSQGVDHMVVFGSFFREATDEEIVKYY